MAKDKCRVLIGIPTQGTRPILRLLHELRRQAPDARLAIALNSGSLEDEVISFCESSDRVDVLYSEAGYVHPRNSILEAVTDEEYVIFFDDDQYPHEHWFRSLLECADVRAADVVLGPVIPRLSRRAWAQAEDLRRPPSRAGSYAYQGDCYSGNTLVRVSSYRGQGLRFNCKYNETGGEDTAFFRCLRDAGARVWMVNGAAADEEIDDARVTAKGRFLRGVSLSRRSRQLDGRSALRAVKRILRGVLGVMQLCAGLCRGDRAQAGRGLFWVGWSIGYFCG